MSEYPSLGALEHRVSLVDELLVEQATLGPAVDRFAAWHVTHAEQPQSAGYRALIPTSQPVAGQQFAFEVNLSQCTGCKACVAACHSLNGLDDEESWRDTGVLLGRDDTSSVQTITTACHHCEDPACANGCPVLAYDKDVTTGIVRHLDDQCIGCSYCILKCPYDVPKYNKRRGIVRKCDMCQGRLEQGEAPACVQACPNHAISIRLVETRESHFGHSFLPGAFDPSYTKPTTLYLGGRAADRGAMKPDKLRIEEAHWPLVLMLVFVQMAVGGFVVSELVRWSGGYHMNHTAEPVVTIISACLGILGVALSGLHLGQPLKAWRIFLGWRKSWLSREAMIFGAFAASCAVSGASVLAGHFWGLSLWWPGWVSAGFGLLGVAASAMVYIDTRRPFWAARIVVSKFFGTTLMLGTGLTACVLCYAGVAAAETLAVSFFVSVWVFGTVEAASVLSALSDTKSPWHKSARVMAMLQPRLLMLRAFLLTWSVLGAPLLMLVSPTWELSLLLVTLAAVLAAQLIERYQFFTASAAPRMPGMA